MNTARESEVHCVAEESAELPEVAGLLPPATEDDPCASASATPESTWQSSGTTHSGSEPAARVPEIDQPPTEAPRPWPKTESPDGEAAPWPWECLPPVVANMGKAIAATMNVPDAMAGACALGVLSLAVSNRVGLQIKPGHVCYGNLYFWVAAPVATGKTPCLRSLTGPLLDWEREAQPDYHQALAEWRVKKAVIDARRKALQREAGLAATPGELHRIADELTPLEAWCEPEPGEPRLFVDDATSEAVARCLSQNGERLGVVSADARKILQVAGGRYSHSGGDQDIWVKGHAGDSVRVERMGRASVELQSPCLSALLLTQPDAFVWVGAGQEARHSGFLSRFLYIVPAPATGVDYPTASIPVTVGDAYRRLVGRVLRLRLWATADGAPGPLVAKFAPAAYELWQGAYRNWTLDARAATAAGAPLMADWIAKAREHSARLALLLAVGEVVSRQGSVLDPIKVGLAHTEAAIRLMDCLRGHARRAFKAMGETGEPGDASRAWDWMDRNRRKLASLREAEGAGRLEAVKPRDLVTEGVAGCKTAEDANRVLQGLADLGYLQRFEWRRPGVAARAQVLWYLRPTGGPSS